MAIKKSNNDINARMFYALRVSEESRVPFLFISAPGMGKSTTVEMFAEIQGYELVILRGNSTSPEEVMGYDVCQPGISTAVHLRPTWYDALLENDKQGKKTLLFLDEITTCPSHVQAALLHLILERKVGNEKIPGSTLIVSAGNYAQSLGSTFDLLAPLMNRFCIFNDTSTLQKVFPSLSSRISCFATCWHMQSGIRRIWNASFMTEIQHISVDLRRCCGVDNHFSYIFTFIKWFIPNTDEAGR